MVFGKKQRKITAVIVFFTILFLLGVVVIKKISYSKYLGTEAEIVSVTTETIGTQIYIMLHISMRSMINTI